MQIDPLLSLLVGALGASLIGLLGIWIQSRNEHAKWLREKRLEAYTSFMRDMSTLQQLATQSPTLFNAKMIVKRSESLTETFTVSGEQVSLLGPRSVNAAGQRWIWAAQGFGASDDEMVKAATSEARWEFLIAAGRVLKAKNVGDRPLTQTEAPIDK
jgi:hypothetical protein